MTATLDLAQRISLISESSTMKVAAEADRLRREGVDVVDFSAGEPDFPTPDNIKKAAVDSATADLAAANAQVRGQLALARANRYRLEHAMEDVNNQIANLRAAVATLNSKKATLDLAKSNLKRGEELKSSGGISKEDLDVRRQTVKVDQAAFDQTLQQVYAIRAGLGLPEQPAAAEPWGGHASHGIRETDAAIGAVGSAPCAAGPLPLAD